MVSTPLKALGLAVVTFVVTVGLVMLLEPTVPMWIAFAPGFVVQNTLERFGMDVTNRTAVTSTLLIWWVAFWVALLIRHRRSQRSSTL